MQYLNCPACSGDLKKEENFSQGFGVIKCSECRTEYPVIEGIFVMMQPQKRLNVFAQTQKKNVLKEGISVREICHKIKKGDIEGVRQSVIYSIPYESYSLPGWVEKISGKLLKRMIRRALRSSYFSNFWARSVARVLKSDQTTAYDAMRAYYQENKHFNYFFYKFGQPRFLTTLSLATTIKFDANPVLDLACGQGHLLHFITGMNPESTAIGLDRNFFQLYLAKKFIAPNGAYVCAEADEKLPFKDRTFNSVICADAFHYFQNKVSCVRDLKKVTVKGGTIIINRAGNQSVEPNEGRELTPQGYAKLFGAMPVEVFDESSLLDRYLNKKKPNLAKSVNPIDIGKKKWLTIVASQNRQVYMDYGPMDKWPHSIGKLALNPLYRKTGQHRDGQEHYKFAYPSDWYEYENSSWRRYAPEELFISDSILSSLTQEKKDAKIDDLINRFVVMGFPQKYM